MDTKILQSRIKAKLKPHTDNIENGNFSELASRLYEQGKLSIGQAAELAGLPKRAFMELLGRANVSAFNYDPEELERDMHNA